MSCGLALKIKTVLKRDSENGDNMCLLLLMSTTASTSVCIQYILSTVADIFTQPCSSSAG